MRHGESTWNLDNRFTESVTTYREHGINLTLAQKGHGAKLFGIELINQLFEDNRIYISKECANLIRELGQYEWITTGVRDMPKDGNDHCLDALRYVLAEIAAGKNRVFSFASTDDVKPAELSKLSSISEKPKEPNIFEQHQYS